MSQKAQRQWVLVVDDDADISKLIASALRAEAFDVTLVERASEALEQVAKRHFDVIVLDVALPDVDGLSLCKQMKEDPRSADIPIILLSGVYQNPRDKVHGLLHGGDDYLTKPLYMDELVARVKVILRRAISLVGVPPVMSYRALTVRREERQATLKDRPLALTPKEFDLLVLFLQRKGKVLSRSFILETVWGYDYYGTTRTVDVHVANLRGKLGSLGSSIETIETVGYRFADH